MKRTTLTLLILLMMLHHIVSGTENYSPTLIVPYKQVDEVELNLHVFLPEGHRSDDRRPAVVFFFGGGWKTGRPGQFYPHSAYLASRGMVAIAAEYRINSLHGTPPSACVQDGKSAVRWIRSHAKALGIDPGRLAGGGGSAGGHVAAATATVEGYNEEGECLEVSCVPDALVLFNPVFDNGPGGYGHDRVVDYWEAFSPMHNLKEGIPPTIVFFGTEDQLVPVATAEAYKAKMENLGSRCDLHLYEGQGHAFFNYNRTEFFLKTVTEADTFLESLGYLEGEPTLDCFFADLQIHTGSPEPDGGDR